MCIRDRIYGIVDGVGNHLEDGVSHALAVQNAASLFVDDLTIINAVRAKIIARSFAVIRRQTPFVTLAV